MDRRAFTTSGTHTVTQYLQNIRVFLIGGGASGTGAFYAGGGAGYITTGTYSGTLGPGHQITVTIGAGGAATAAGNTANVNNGGTTTINIAGTSFSAEGGKGSLTSSIDVGSSGGGGGGNAGAGGYGGSGGSDGGPGDSYPGGTGMGVAAFNVAIYNFISGYNIYDIRAGAGGGPPGGTTHQGGGGGGGLITGTSTYPLSYPTASGGAQGYGAGGSSGGLFGAIGLEVYYPGGAGAAGMVYMFADIIPAISPSLTFSNMNATYRSYGSFEISQPSTNSGGSFSYSVIGGSSVSISGTTVYISGVGITTVRAYQAASGNFLAGSVDGTIFVSKATPSLTVSTNRYITKYILNGTINFNVFSTNAESGFTRQFSSNNSGIISIPNSASPIATITGSGKTTINVTQTTTTHYNAVTVNNIITFVIIGPSVAYSSEDMTSLDLSGNNLSGSTFTSCNLTNANLYNATVNSSTNLIGSTLTSIKSGRITGFTTLLPPNYKMI